MKLSDSELILLNETMLALRLLETSKKNKSYQEKAEQAVERLRNLGFTDEHIHREYYKFKGEILTTKEQED